VPTLITHLDATVPVAADFNSNFTALNQVCGTTTSYTSYTAGDMIYASATTALSKLAIGAARRMLASTGTAPEWVPDILNLSTTSVGNVGGGTDDLITYSLPAAILGTNAEAVLIITWGTGANNANAKTLTLNFGATAILTTSLTTGQADTWVQIAVVARTAAATQEAIAFLLQGGTTTLIDVETTQPAETLSGAVTIKCTGAATTDNDILQRGQLVLFLNGG